MIFFFNDTATTEIYTLSLHDALPILAGEQPGGGAGVAERGVRAPQRDAGRLTAVDQPTAVEVRKVVPRSEEHTSELQSRQYLVCRLLLEKKKNTTPHVTRSASRTSTI